MTKVRHCKNPLLGHLSTVLEHLKLFKVVNKNLILVSAVVMITFIQPPMGVWLVYTVQVTVAIIVKGTSLSSGGINSTILDTEKFYFVTSVYFYNLVVNSLILVTHIGCQLRAG